MTITLPNHLVLVDDQMIEDAADTMRVEIPGIDPPHAHECLPLSQDRLPVKGAEPAMWCVAAHGGAGATTLSAQLAPVGDSGGVWPAHKDQSPYCVIVTRATVGGFKATNKLLRQYVCGLAGNVRVLAVVVIQASPKKPSKEIQRARALVEPIGNYAWEVIDIPFIDDYLNHTPDELALWTPGEEEEEKKKKQRHINLADRVPDRIESVGEQLMDLFTTDLSSKE